MKYIVDYEFCYENEYWEKQDERFDNLEEAEQFVGERLARGDYKYFEIFELIEGQLSENVKSRAEGYALGMLFARKEKEMDAKELRIAQKKYDEYTTYLRLKEKFEKM